jgi:LuxR family maltose regulon positive regulatory protein
MTSHHIAGAICRHGEGYLGVEMAAASTRIQYASRTNIGRSAGAIDGGSVIPRPALFGLLSGAGRVVQVSAPPGSGKTVLLRSWISETGLDERAAWVSIATDECAPQAFWLSVADSLRRTRAGTRHVRVLTAAPDLDGWTIVERLISDLDSLDEPLCLVVDDLQELRGEDAIRQLALLVQNASTRLRFVFLARRDLPLGLHRLRLDGEVTELSADDLRFTTDESRALMELSGVRLSDSALEALVETTEGWAAGLRLAALSMARHPDPEHFATAFGGHERSIAEYLLAEVLERQPQEVSRLLLRTSVLERVSGPLADRLTGGTGTALILSELEEAGAFVVALGPEREWFRYHHLFRDLLLLELRRTAPDELAALHGAAAEWHAERGDPIEAIRHAQAAEDWELAAELLIGHWFGLYLDGRQTVARQLIAVFPDSVVAADAELAALAAFNEWAEGSVIEAKRYLAMAQRGSAAVPDDRQARFQAALSIVRLSLATARNDIDAVAKEVQRLIDPPTQAVTPWHGTDLYALAQASLGIAQIWTEQLEAAESQLERALAEARRVHRPVLESQVLAHWALVALGSSLSGAEQRARAAIEVARANGWEGKDSAAVASLIISIAMLLRGRLEEGEQWLVRAEIGIAPGGPPTTASLCHGTRALLEFAYGRYEQALAAYRACEWEAGLLVTRRVQALRVRSNVLILMVGLGQIEEVQQAFENMEYELRDTAEMRTALATLRLAQGDPEGATAALASVVNGATPRYFRQGHVQSLLLEATARDAMGDGEAATNALERALDLAESDGLLLPFLLVPVGELLERHRLSGTSHAALIAEAMMLSTGRAPPSSPSTNAELVDDPLTETELRVLRFLPTNLQAREIAAELFVSVNTVRTHMRHIYSKLGVHSRSEAVEHAQAGGLLSPSRLRH